MSEKLVIRPPEQSEVNVPMIFLAGPIQGAPDWHSQATEFIHGLRPDVVIASPKRDSFSEDFDYDEQADWETLNLRRAGLNGVILFWLAHEETPIPGRSYAQTTRFEMGEWLTQHKYMKARIVVGIEKGYSGERYVRKRLSESPEIPIFDSLEEVCSVAVSNIK